MPNYNKSFNFRNGVQVDVDDLIVRGNLVGIGTTIPRADLDVRGKIDVTGIVTTSNLFVSGISTFADEIHIGTGITISAQNGIISATTFIGDATFLENLPTSQWVDVDPGVGYTSIYNVGPVGVGTTNPIQTFQVGGNPDNPLHFGVGIDSTRGNIRTTGIITASSFIGSGLGITGITADNITSGNLDSERLPSSFSGLDEVGATNLVISGVGTVVTINSTTGTITTLSATDTTVSNNLNVGGALTATTLNVSSTAEFNSNVLLNDNDRLLLGNNNDLEIFHDGTNSIIQSDTGDLQINSGNSAGNVEINLDNNVAENTRTHGAKFIKNGAAELYFNNTKRFETTGVGATVVGDFQVSRHSSILGVSTLTSVSASDATIGVSTITDITATEIVVQKLTTSGVSTFAGAIDASAGATIDNIQIGITDNNQIDTTSGNLIIDSASGTTTINDNLIVSGTANIGSNVTVTGDVTSSSIVVDTSIAPDADKNAALGANNNAFSQGFIGEITVGSASSNTVSTRSESLILDSTQGTVIIQDDLNVIGVTTLTALTVNTIAANTEFTPSSDKSSGIGSVGTAFANAFLNEVTVGVAASNTVSTRSGSLILDSTQGTVIVQDDLNVAGVTTLTSLTADTITVNTEFTPSSDKSSGIGSVGTAFAEAFLNEVTVGAAASNKISTREGSLLIDSTQGTVIVQDDLNVTGVTTLTSLTVTDINAVTSLSPTVDQTVPLGSPSLRYSELYVDNIRVGVGSDQEIRAESGNLELTAPYGSVKITNFFPVGVVTFSNSVLPDTDKTRPIGDSSNAFSQAFIDEVRIGSVANTIDTRSGELILNSAENRVIIGAGVSLSTVDITSNVFVGSGSTSFTIISSDQSIGIGTSAPSSAIQVVKYIDADLELISETGNSKIVFASEIGNTDDSSTINYDGTNFTISNKDSSGDISIDLATGSGINTSSNFKVLISGNEILHITHDELVGINNPSPTKELDVVGDLLVSNDAVITGIVTIGSGANQVTLGSSNVPFNSNIDGNINSTGVSTFATLNSSIINSDDLKITVGIATLLVGGTIGTDAQTTIVDATGDTLTVLGSASISNTVVVAHDGNGGVLGIGTNVLPSDDRDTATIGNLSPVSYGELSHTGNMSVVGDDGGSCIFVHSINDPSVPTLKKGRAEAEYSWQHEYKVGINTYVPRSAFDLGACNSPMIVPSLSQQTITTMINTTSNATMSDPTLPSGNGTQVIGGLFFSKPENRLKVGLATANSEDSYVGIVTVAANSSAFEAIAFPQMTTTNRNTMNTAGGIPDGSVIYNTTTNKLQVKAGGSFVDLH